MGVYGKVKCVAISERANFLHSTYELKILNRDRTEHIF